MNTVTLADICIVQHSRLLLVQQRKAAAYGAWSLPGGHVETGESAEAAIVREVREELGLRLRRAQLLDAIKHAQSINEGKAQLTTFIAAHPGGSIRLQEKELIGYGWFTFQEISSIANALRSPWITELAEKVLKNSPD